MPEYILPMEKLINELSKLPTIGKKSAQRLAFHILKSSKEEAISLARAIIELKEKIITCSICFNITDVDPCRICTDGTRDKTILCIVEEPKDLMIIEKMHCYKGLYHILEGTLSPLKGITPDNLRIKELLERVKKGNFKEVIVATNPSVEGEATATYLSEILQPFKITVTRLGMGIPMGSDLEYIDQMTISKAFEGRRKI